MDFIKNIVKNRTFEQLFQSLWKTAFNQSKLPHKRPKVSKSIKFKTRLKTSKTATKCGKPLGSDFRDQNKVSLYKDSFLSKVVQNRLKSIKIYSKTTNTAKQHKNWKSVEKVKNCWKLALAVQKKFALSWKLALPWQTTKKVFNKTPFLTKTVQNASNHSKLAAKRPKCTKTENRSETF